MITRGQRYRINGDSTTMWIEDYNTNIDTTAEVLETPNRQDKKVLVCLDYIDHESNVNVYIRRSALKPQNLVQY